jgi:tetratricopeptide (TPR) repeat protein
MLNFENALEIDQKCTEGYIARGNLKIDNNDDEGALNDFNEALKLDPKNSHAFFNRGRLKEYLNDTDGALSDFDKAIDMDKENAEAYFYRGKLKSQINDNEGALSDLNKTIKLNPQKAEAFYYRGTLKVEMEQWGYVKEALSDFDKAIKLDPNDAEAYLSRGSLRANHFLTIYDNDPETMAKLYVNDKEKFRKEIVKFDLDDVEKDFESAIRIDPTLDSKELQDLRKGIAEKNLDWIIQVGMIQNQIDAENSGLGI